MIIPIGGVWRPDDEPVDLFLEADEDQCLMEEKVVCSESTTTTCETSKV